MKFIPYFENFKGTIVNEDESYNKFNVYGKYEINTKLVRGLDYYCHTAFEFTTDLLGAQNAVLAGGRYDSLIKTMGGPDTPAIGFAGGIERLMLLSDKEISKNRPVCILPIGEEAEKQSLNILKNIRESGIYTEMIYAGNIKKKFKKADNMNATCAIVIGDNEIANNKLKVKLLDLGQEHDISKENLISFLREKI